MMKNTTTAWPLMALICLFLLLTTEYSAQAQHHEYTTQRIQGTPPRIDGLATEKAWETVLWQGNFTQREPREGQDPSQPTEFKLLYDDNYLYVFLKAYDNSPEKIVRRMTRRDEIEGDLLAVEIDSYNDDRTAFSFMVSAAGVKIDRLITSDGDNEDPSWDPLWEVATTIHDKGWNAEMKIPLNQLRFDNTPEQHWGLQVGRFLFRNEELSMWQLAPMEAAGWVRHFGTLHGIKNIRPKRQIEIAPYLVSQLNTFKKEPDNPYRQSNHWGNQVGLDGKIGLTNDFTLDFSVNPDFGQVEADPSELNLSAYESYFQEKRPFFIEGRNITSLQLTRGGSSFSRDNLFYSRRIGSAPHYYPDLNDDEYTDMPEQTRILGAVKLTGKTRNGLSVGIIESLTARETAEIDNQGETRNEVVEPLTNYFIASAEQELNEGNTQVGGMVTATNRAIDKEHLNFLNDNAYTGGLTFTQYWNDRKYYITSQLAYSQVNGSTEAIHEKQIASQRYFQRPDASYVKLDTTRTQLSGHAGNITIGKSGSSKFRFMGWITWRSPGFELNDVGYSRQSDIIFQVYWMGYRITEPFSIFRVVNLNFDQWSGWDFGGNNLFKGINVNGSVQLTNYWSFGGGINYDFPSVSNSLLRGGPVMHLPAGTNSWLFLSSDERKAFTAQVFSQFSRSKSSFRNGLGIDFTYRPFNALKISFMPDYSISKQTLQYVDDASDADQNRYVFAHLKRITTDFTLRLDLAINPELTVQYYGSPFITAGSYSDYKWITEPAANEFTDRYQLYSEEALQWNEESEEYQLDSDADGHTDVWFSKPDFNFKQFRSNLVVRWEYRPGSVAYLVWSQSRTGYDEYGSFRYNRDMPDLFRVFPDNTFLLKWSYRFLL